MCEHDFTFEIIRNLFLGRRPSFKKMVGWRTTSTVMSSSTLTTYLHFTKKIKWTQFYKFEIEKALKYKKASNMRCLVALT